MCQDFGYIHLGGQRTKNLSLLAVLTMQNMTFLIGSVTRPSERTSIPGMSPALEPVADETKDVKGFQKMSEAFFFPLFLLCLTL